MQNEYKNNLQPYSHVQAVEDFDMSQRLYEQYFRFCYTDEEDVEIPD